MSDDLIAFLTARLNEAEHRARLAQKAIGGRWDFWGVVAQQLTACCDTVPGADWATLMLMVDADPERLLREVENDRELIARYEKFRDWPRPSQYQRGMVDAYAEAIRLRAQRFSDHPSFKRDWAFD